MFALVVAASAIGGCDAFKTDVGSAERQVVSKVNERPRKDSERDASAEALVDEEATPTSPAAAVAVPLSSHGFTGDGGVTGNGDITGDDGPTSAPHASWGPNVTSEGMTSILPNPLGPTACAVESTQQVDVPRKLRSDGGSWELRRVFDSPSDAIPNITTESPVKLDPDERAFDITTEGSDFQVVLFRDDSGRIVDAQWHQSRCPGARPARTNVVLDVPETYETIQAAIDAAQPGDTVRVAPGVYNESLRLAPNITLLGAGPDETILDAEGRATKLIDATGALGSSVIGFRLRNVGLDDACGNPDDPLGCAGSYYPAALYADGHIAIEDRDSCCHVSTFLAAHNVFEGNAYGVMAYHRTQAVLFDNVFINNTNAVVANYAADAYALLENNVFASTNGLDIVSGSASVFASHNAFEGELDCTVEYIQRGRFSCNAFSGAITCDVLTSEDTGNIDFSLSDAVSASVEAGCVEARGDGGTIQWFDFAGETGREGR